METPLESYFPKRKILQSMVKRPQYDLQHSLLNSSCAHELLEKHLRRLTDEQNRKLSWGPKKEQKSLFAKAQFRSKRNIIDPWFVFFNFQVVSFKNQYSKQHTVDNCKHRAITLAWIAAQNI